MARPKKSVLLISDLLRESDAVVRERCSEVWHRVCSSCAGRVEGVCVSRGRRANGMANAAMEKAEMRLWQDGRQ